VSTSLNCKIFQDTDKEKNAIREILSLIRGTNVLNLATIISQLHLASICH
jgi:hypothetical protein